MDDTNLDAKSQASAVEAPAAAPESSTETTQDATSATTAEVAKTEGTEGQVQKTEEPWHKDPRFKQFIEEKKHIEERIQAFETIEKDPDFAAFLAFKRQKEAMSQQENAPAKPDFSRMTPDEYAGYVAEQAKEAARMEYANLAESNKKGDEMSREATSFAESCGVDKATFQKEYAPKIMSYYESMAKKIGADKMDSFVMAVPPKEVFKNFYFDKAAEIGVKKYKETVDKAKSSGFEVEGQVRNETQSKDPKSRFEKAWSEAFGSATELPMSAVDKRR